MTVTVKHSKTNAISDWTQAQLDEQIALGNFAEGTVLADIVLPSDWNNDHTLTGVGTMAEQNANSVAITGGTINNTSIGATTASTGKFTSVTTPSVTASSTDLTLSAISTGNINFNTPNGTALKILPVTSASSNWLQVGNPTTTVVRLSPAGTSVCDFRINSQSFTSFYTGSPSDGLSDGANQMRISHTASAVNYVQVTGAATGNRPAISSQGSDTNIGLSFDVKGGPNIFFRSYGGTNNQLKISGTNASVNNHVISGGASTIAPSLSVEGTDTNISMAFQPKGTGAIDLAAGSSGVNISNGGTVTAITRTAAGTGYTSLPTMTISAPTTAGGVQATATYTMGLAGVPTITSGGTGYTVGDTLTFVGGTGGVATLTVSTVSAGVITGVTVGSFGTYTALPTNPISVTGGTGSSATFTATWAINSGFTITNAGSGYIEQPTVTFSGGGGSGASAYATVGSSTIVRGLAATSQFHLPSGETFRLTESGGTAVVGLNVINGSSSQNTVYMYPYGSAANPNTILGSKGTGFVGLFTGSNNDSNGIQQFRVSHTASAVNYVQVTGGATTAAPVISAQGSDTNITLGITPKGSGLINLNAQTRLGFNSTNYITIAGSATTVSPTISALGGDTNIDLALTPKGTGVVRFGTYTANMALTVQGYIEIKDSGGTLRKLAVIA